MSETFHSPKIQSKKSLWDDFPVVTFIYLTIHTLIMFWFFYRMDDNVFTILACMTVGVVPLVIFSIIFLFIRRRNWFIAVLPSCLLLIFLFARFDNLLRPVAHTLAMKRIMSGYREIYSKLKDFDYSKGRYESIDKPFKNVQAWKHQESLIVVMRWGGALRGYEYYVNVSPAKPIDIKSIFKDAHWDDFGNGWYWVTGQLDVHY